MDQSLVYMDDCVPLHRQRPVGRGHWKLHVALAGTVVNLIIFAMFAVFFSASLAGLQKARLADSQLELGHLVIDHSALRACAASPTAADDNLPCLHKDGRYLTSDKPLGPWKCSAGGQSCPTALNGSWIEVKRAGVYLIVAQTMIVDSLPSPVTLLVSVNDAAWATCALNVTGSQLPCSVTTVRRLSAGDRVTVQLPQAYRLIDPHYSITYVDLVQLSVLDEKN